MRGSTAAYFLTLGKDIQLTVMEETTVTYCSKKIKLGDSIYLETT